MPAATFWTCLWESVEVLTALPDGVADACIVTLQWWAGFATLVSVTGGLLSLLGGSVALLLHWRLATLRRRGGVSTHNGGRRAP